MSDQPCPSRMAGFPKLSNAVRFDGTGRDDNLFLEFSDFFTPSEGLPYQPCLYLDNCLLLLYVASGSGGGSYPKDYGI
jgi:hypothetical protein